MSVRSATIPGMSTEPAGRIPALTLGWRLKMSLGDMSREQIAAVMDVTPSTISRWMADKGAPPKRPMLREWALATGVDPKWLETGAGSPGGPGSDDEPTTPSDELAALTARKARRARGNGVTRRYLAA